MSQIRKELKYWCQIFLIPIYMISCIFPRSSKIWAFGSTFGNRFADNPKYFYLYVSQHHKTDIKAIWISKSKVIIEMLNEKGYQAYYHRSFKGIWYGLRAKVYIYDNYTKDISYWLSGRAIKMNLWHGIPLKKINMDNKHDKVRFPENRWKKFKWSLRRMTDEKPSHYVVTTSINLKGIFSSAFRTQNILTTGYPRNDIIVTSMIKKEMSKIELEEYTKIEELRKNNGIKYTMLYLPTFRESETKFFDIVDVNELNEFLKQEHLLLCVKLHPKSKLASQFKSIENDNIIMIDKDSDPYIFIEHSHALITDYSSIYFDYLLSNKPIIFFNYDIDEYLTNSREMYFEYTDMTPGQRVDTFEGLKNSIKYVLDHSDSFFEERNRIKEYLFDDTEQCSSNNLYEQLLKLVNQKEI